MNFTSDGDRGSNALVGMDRKRDTFYFHVLYIGTCCQNGVISRLALKEFYPTAIVNDRHFGSIMDNDFLALIFCVLFLLGANMRRKKVCVCAH